jgi:hypothetical protein
VTVLEPVELEVRQHHPYESRKPSPGCAVCKRAKYAQEHLGQPTSFNALGSGSVFAYQAMLKGWKDALTLALEASGLPRGLGGVLVEGVAVFPDRRKRDQGNHRVIVEKALGDALVDGGWLADDRWEMYEFGNLQQFYDKGTSATRLMVFPRPADT